MINIWKRMLSLTLSVAILLSTVPLSALAQENEMLLPEVSETAEIPDADAEPVQEQAVPPAAPEAGETAELSDAELMQEQAVPPAAPESGGIAEISDAEAQAVPEVSAIAEVPHADNSLIDNKDHVMQVEAGSPVAFDVVNIRGSLELTLYDSFTVNGSFEVTGDLLVYGDESTENELFTALSGVTVGGNVIFHDVGLELNGKVLEASGSAMEFKNSQVSNAEFVGFADNSGSPAVLTLTNADGKTNVFTNVAILGARPAHQGVVTLAGNQAAGDSAIYDVELVYHGMDGKPIIPGSGWITHYRRNNTEILGYVLDGNYYELNEENKLTLPEYTVTGYKYAGWVLDPSETIPIAGVTIGVSDLYTLQTPKKVYVTYDIGFEPNEGNSQVYETLQRINRFEALVGSPLTLQTPWRMGYNYAGVRALTSKDPEHLYNTTIILNPDVMRYNPEDDSFYLELETKWNPLEFVVNLELPAVNALVKDSETEWMTASEFAAAHAELTYEESGSTGKFLLSVPYDSVFLDVLEDAGLSGLAIQSTDETKKFIGWVTTTGLTPSATMRFTWGELFGKHKDDQTLSVFQEQLERNPLTFQTVFGDADQVIRFDDAAQWSKEWTISVDGKPAEFEGDTIKLKSGSTIIWKCITDTDGSRPQNNFGLWIVQGSETGKFYRAKELVKGDRYYEENYSVYTLTMPLEDCTAAFSAKTEKVELNLAVSPITEGSVTVNGRARSGFWTNELLTTMSPLVDMEGSEGYGSRAGVTQGTGRNDGTTGIALRYFYEWNENLSLWITTENVKTRNQYYVIRSGSVNERLIYFRDCYLEAFEGYHALKEETVVDDKLASTFCNVYVEWIGGGQTTNLKIDGKNNIIGSVGSNNIGSRIFRMSGTSADSELRMGCVFSFSVYNQSYASMSFYPYASDDPADLRVDNYPYIAYGRLQAFGSGKVNLYLPEKSVRGSLSLGSNTGFVHVKNVGDQLFASTGLIVLEGYQLAGYSSLTFTGSASAIIKGNVQTTYGFQDNGCKIDTTGLVAFLGNTVNFQHMEVLNGTVLANSIETNLYTRLRGGTIITNNIRNPYTPAKSGGWINTNNLADQNGDDYPFKTYPYQGNHGVKNHYLFGGSSIYLLGYYDDSVEATRGKTETVIGEENQWDTVNPVARIAKAMIDPDPGDGKTYVLATSVDKVLLEQVFKDAKEKYSGNETIMVGNSAVLPDAANSREFRFEGGEIYSVGNMTLYNTTIVSGGTIVCGGAFTSKQDLTITGGSVTAAEVGNSAGQLRAVAGETKRYANVTITGGTITTDRIGARADTEEYPVDHHSNLDIGGNAVIQPLTGETVMLVNDAYVNYSYDGNMYTKPEGMPEYLRATGVYGSDAWSSDVKTFPQPQFADGQDASTLQWSLSGAEMQKILGTTADGKLDLDNTEELEDVPLGDKDHTIFYVVNDKPYRLTVRQDGDYIRNFSEENQPAPNAATEYELSSGKDITLEIPQEMTDKIVVWYRDDSGMYHSVPYKLTGTTLAFSMPFADCELYVSREITVYLDQTAVGLTATGFRLEEQAGREDGHFQYAGDLRITDSRAVSHDTSKWESYEYTVKDVAGNKITTDNRIVVDGGFRQNGRTISLYRFQQKYSDNYNILIEEGAEITFTVDEGVSVGKIWHPLGAELTFTGKTRESLLHFEKSASGSSSLHINAAYTGNVTLENLTFCHYYQLIGSESQSSNEIIFRNCTSISRNNLALYCDTVTYDGVIMDIHYAHTSDGSLGNRAKKINIKGSEIRAHSELVRPLLPKGVDVYMEDSHLTHFHEHTDKCTYSQKNTVVQVNRLTMVNSQFEAEHGLYVLEQLTVSENSVLELENRIISPDVQVLSGGQIIVPYVVTAGYNHMNSGAADIANATNKRKLEMTINGANQKGILVDGGHIEAEFVGGDYNGKVALKSGSIDASYIGTYGAYFFRELVDTGVYAYQETYTWQDPELPPVRKSDVTISGGTVTIREGGVLGGGDSTVRITGGVVEGADITGGDIQISGKVEVNVENILSTDVGAITIDAATGEIANPYQGTDRKHPTVGVYVRDTLRARNLYIRNGSAVYAVNANSYADQGSSNFIIDEGKDTGLYTSSYGGLGAGSHNVDVEDEGDLKNIWGLQAIAVRYDLNIPAWDPDPAENHPENPVAYAYRVGETMDLEEPTRSNYEFAGWSDSLGGSNVTEINCGVLPNGNIYTLTANWKPVEVEFKVRMDVSKEAGFVNDADREFRDIPHTVDSEGRYVYERSVKIPYGSVMIGAGSSFALADYHTYSRQITRVQWNGEDINPGSADIGTKVSAQMVAEYKENGVVYLDVATVGPTFHPLTFDINRVGGKPEDAVFVNDPNAFEKLFNQELGANFSKSSEPQVSAVGYTFKGWNSKRDGTGENISYDRAVDDSFPQTWYAIWEARSYTFHVEAITTDNNGKIADGTYHITEDTEIPTDPGVEVKNGSVTVDGSHAFTVNMTYDEYLTGLPTAWREGSVFQRWYYYAGNEKIELNNIEEILFSKNDPAFQKLNIWDSADASLTLYAEYRNIWVTYDLRGGRWVEETNAVKEYNDSGVKLLAYEAVSEIPDGAVAVGEKDGLFALSTTAEYFKANGYKYVDGDYRELFQYNGYTFDGWFEEDGTAITVTPKYNDITVHAKWEHNWYNLNLYSSKAGMVYPSGATFVTLTANGERGDDNTAKKEGPIKLYIGTAINENSCDQWPDRETWGSIGSTENTLKPRPLWGFTFLPLDPMTPGSTTEYANYFGLLTQMYAEGGMHLVKNKTNTGGSIFQLPDVAKMKELLQKNGYDPDLLDLPDEDIPSGYEFDLYATYNDYALIFMQYYRDAVGNEVKRVIKAVNYGLVDEIEFEDPYMDEMDGYTHLGWYINSTTLDEDHRYNSEWTTEFLIAQLNGRFKEEAIELGTYDVIAYSVYAATEEMSKNLSSDPKAQVDPETIAESRIWNATVPMNMQPGTTTFEVTIPQGLNLISRKDMLSQQYQTDLGDGKTANNTVALVLNLNGQEVDLAEESLDTEILKPGDPISLTLYHSHVITSASFWEVSAALRFKDNGTPIQGQLLTLNAGINLDPAQYTVIFNANTEGYVIQRENSFTTGREYTQRISRVGALNLNFRQVMLPQVEGYLERVTSDGWTVEGTSYQIVVTDGIPSFTGLNPDNGGTIEVKAGWEPKIHTLTITKEVLDRWDISCGDSPVTKPGDLTVAYRTPVVFNMKEGVATEAAYVFLNSKTGEQRLDNIPTDESGSYVLSMPDEDVTASYKSVMELYLEEDTISIANKAGTVWVENYKGESYTWPGSFIILMDADNNQDHSETHNVVKLAGDLSEVDITLGDLNITPDKTNNKVEDSITLAPGTKAVLNGSYNGKDSQLTLRNILVETGADLTVNAGHIHTQETEVLLSTCWIVGKNAASVTLNGMTLTQQVDNLVGGRYLIVADTVTMEKCSIGNEAVPVVDVIYANQNLTLTETQLQQDIRTPLGDVSPIGAGSQVLVTDSVITAEYSQGGSANVPVGGQLILKDTESEVTIGGQRILELGNGKITITEAGVSQGDSEHSYSGSYLLLEEKLGNDKGALIVEGLAENAAITIQDSLFDADEVVQLGDVKILADVQIRAEALITMQKTVQIAEGATLTVEAQETNGISLGGQNFGSPGGEGIPGDYVQNGGILTADGQVGQQNMDVTLNGVTANAQSLIAENLTLKDSRVTAEGVVGSYGINDGAATTVTLAGETTVDAAVIGALGVEEKTFTYVTIPVDSDVTVSGKLNRDWYRIDYVLEEGYTLADGTRKVLRTEETFDAPTGVTGTATTDLEGYPYLPADPDAAADAAEFLTWYYVNSENQYVALDVSMEDVPGDITLWEPGLQISTADYLEPGEDGTRTLVLMPRLTISGKMTLKKGRLVEVFRDGTEQVATPADNAWTAMIQVKAFRTAGMKYQLLFGSPLPVGTDLTLTWLTQDTGMPIYYSYTVTGNDVNELDFRNFKAMGTNEPFALTEGIEKSDTFLVAVDYTDAFATGNADMVTEGTIQFLAYTGAQAQEEVKVGEGAYSATESSTQGTLEIEGAQLSITIPQNVKYTGKTVAVLAASKESGYIPYLKEAKLGDHIGTILGGDHYLFVLGSSTKANYEITGIEPGAFNWTLVLIDTPAQHNTWKDLT